MYYLRIEDIENNIFGFAIEGIHEILKNDIAITEEEYNKYFELHNKGKQFRIVNLNATKLFEIIEEYVKEVNSEKTPIEVLEEENKNFKKQQILQDENISLTEDAVNCILMGGMSTYSNKRNGGMNSMASYLGSQIYKGKLEYDEVIAKYTDLKMEIDLYLEIKLKNDGLKLK